jgi:hypothetical protein
MACSARADGAAEMPFTFEIDRANRILKVEGAGRVTSDDLERLLAAIDWSDVMPFGKLVDLLQASNGISKAEGLQACGRIRDLQANRIVGPMAIVTDQDVPSTVLGALATPDREIAVFATSKAALRWLAKEMDHYR